ncbi:RNA-binding protein [Variovorax humicola]|uniref:RNA-binding protein n=1 Tax=Variovorax humicola TaxID=1769758 RepID=A0ABU8W9T8_9BURK
MGKKLYVGNLAYSVRDNDLERAFSQYGSVASAKVMMERDTDRSKGFGFVEMGTDAEALAAIEGLNGQSLGGRSLTVNEARPMESGRGGRGCRPRAPPRLGHWRRGTTERSCGKCCRGCSYLSPGIGEQWGGPGRRVRPDPRELETAPSTARSDKTPKSRKEIASEELAI